MPKKINISKLVKRLVIAGLMAIILGLFVSNKIVKRYGYDGIGDFLHNYWSNKELAAEADPVYMEIDMSDSDYQFIEDKREEALDRGIQINVGDNYVDCQVSVDGKQTDAQIRLKGHMTDHLEGDKWSFRVKSDQEILGMYRFSLQHPGTRNYTYEWVYHQLLKQEGIIYLNYDFVHLKLRDKDLGIYALEEHFGQHVLEHNDRPPGAILRWNPNLYWEGRIDELDGVYLDQQYAAYTSSFAEPYDRGTVKKDSVLTETYVKGATLLEQFRRGERNASEVFDVPLMAKFHAIVDLVGGYHSLDWSDVKFYYNSETQLIEPVGYESFSVRKTEKLAGQRIPSDYEPASMDYHDRLFADPIFFRVYIQEIERICDQEYFNEFIASIKNELHQKLAILATEWPERKFSYDPYFENIDLIKHNLELPIPFHAFFESGQDSTIMLSLAPVSDYPIEIFEIEIDKKQTIPIENYILPAKTRDSFAHYYKLEVKGVEEKFKNMFLKARIPGGSAVFEVEVAEYPSYRTDYEVEIKNEQFLDISEHDLIRINQFDSTYFFDAINININQDYVLNNGTLKLMPGQNISFTNGSINLRNASLRSIGTEEHAVLITSGDPAFGFTFKDSDVVFNNTDLAGENEGMVAINSTVMFEQCLASKFKGGLIKSKNSKVVLNQCALGSSALGKHYQSDIKIKDLTAKKGTYFLASMGSTIRIRFSSIEEYDQVFELRDITNLRIWSSSFDKNHAIATLNSSSDLYAYACDFGEAEFGFKVEKIDQFGGASKTVLRGTKNDKVKTLYN